jgi:signal transduction histidine kinase
MLFTTTDDGRLISVNQSGVNIFRYTDKNEMYGINSIASLFGNPDEWPFLQQRIKAHGRMQDLVMEMQRRDGSRFVASINVNLRMDPDKKMFFDGLLREFTELSELRKKLRETEQQNRDIKERVLQTLMMLSHDLRGPLTSLSAGLKLLIRGTFGNMLEKVETQLKSLMRQTVSLTGIVEDYLARAALIDGFGEILKESLDLGKEIIDPVLGELSDEILARNITVEYRGMDPPAEVVTIHAGRIWLKSIYRNLLKNAVKYGGEGCSIICDYKDHGDCHRLSVYNSGVPIPENLREKLFTKFGNIGNPAGNAAVGAGLGLYLVREIIHKHGGDIWYEANQTGSNFVFTMPKENE